MQFDRSYFNSVCEKANIFFFPNEEIPQSYIFVIYMVYLTILSS